MFQNFHPEGIIIPHKFNNYYKDEKDWISKIGVFIGSVLPWLSNEDEGIFSDISKSENVHLHPIKGKDDLLKEIFSAYSLNFDEDRLDNIYQIEMIHSGGTSRIVFERAENMLSFLFFDTNHHIYLNKKMTKKNDSLFFEFCPVYNSNNCKRMDYFDTCFAVDYINMELLQETYNYNKDHHNLF